MDARSPIMWPVFGLLIALSLQIAVAADTTVISMVVPAEGHVAMIQKASFRRTVRLVGKPQKAAEQPRRTLQEMTSDDFKQLIDKTSQVEVQLSETDSEAPAPSEREDAKDESVDQEEAEDMPGVTKDVQEQYAKIGHGADARSQPTRLDEEEAMSKNVMAKVDVVKGQSSKFENAADRSEVDNQLQDATGTEETRDQSVNAEDAEQMREEAERQSLKPENPKEEPSRMQTGKMEQMPKAINDANEQSDVDAEKQLAEKDQPSQMVNASELAKIENAAEEADAKAPDTEDQDTEKTNTMNEETDIAKTEGAGIEAQEDAEIAAANGQENESKDAEEAPEINEVKEENNVTLASEDAESEKFDDKTTDNAVKEGEETGDDGDTIDATTHAKNSELQAVEQGTENAILTSKDVPTSGKDDYHWKKVRGPGDTLSLDNAGFEAVVKLKDTEQASAYIRRILRKQGFLVSNNTGLLKYASVCSKGQGAQSFEHLSKQILKAVTEPDGWAGIVRKDSPEVINPAFKALVNQSTGAGLTSSLNQVGYLAVANLTSTSEMSVFIHRIINHLSLVVVDTWGLMGIIQYYDGEDMVQSFAALVTELLGTAVQPGKWLSVDPERP